MKFKSKVDWWAHITFASMPLVNIALIVLFILSPNVINGICAVLFLAINIVILPWWFNMHYILDEDELVVRLGGFGKGKRIAYKKITSVKETRQPWSSAALSLDRIEIKFRIGQTGSTIDVIYISPREKQEFMRLLGERTGL
jgi:hypothetical protein